MSLEYIKKYVELSMEIDDISTKSRKQKNVLARSLFCKLARVNTMKTYEQIGKFIGLNHATVIHACKKVFNDIKKYEPKIYTIYKGYEHITSEQIDENYLTYEKHAEIINALKRTESKVKLLKMNSFENDETFLINFVSCYRNLNNRKK